MLAGDSARAAEEITAEASAASLPASRRTGADSCARYLNARHQYLRYDQALAEGWPIATGVIEGACRHLIADRLDIGGARWGLDGPEAVLTLRAVISNGDFEEYWSYHLAREHQRLRPGTKQGRYALGARVTTSLQGAAPIAESARKLTGDPWGRHARRSPGSAGAN